jgi:integrase
LCSEDEPDWSKLTAEYVTNFVLQKVAVARAEKGRIVTAVRSFLHFLAAEGVVPRQMVRAIPRIRRWRYADLPKRLSAEQLNVVLNACQSEKYGSLRDRSFIALLARLAVRPGELRALRLDDIDWTQGLVHIKQSKTGRGRTLPLADDAGNLLVKYIREERPATAYREVFLTSVTPRRPIGDCVTTTFVKVFLKKLDLDGPGRGAHSFRHTAASLMVENGATLKEVADVLGHRVLSTTGIYVKLDKSSLLEVALPWKGGNV